MTRQLIFVHGRSQQRLDSIALKKEWIDAFKFGLAKSGLTMPCAEGDVHFPYYGDTLDQMAAGRSAEEAASVVVRGTELDRETEAFLRGWLIEIQHKAGIQDSEVDAALSSEVRAKGPLNWGWVQGILQVLDQRVPGASGLSVALATKDVYDYLTNTTIRDKLDVGVRSAFAAGTEAVVVSHSLGTVVAYNVLNKQIRDSVLDAPLFVTLGSPLAVTAVKRNVRPIAHPECVKRWFNAMDDRDVVALYPLDPEHFDVAPAIQNKTDVDNPTPNRHGIAGYLGDAEVARRIHDALTA